MGPVITWVVDRDCEEKTLGRSQHDAVLSNLDASQPMAHMAPFFRDYVGLEPT